MAFTAAGSATLALNGRAFPLASAIRQTAATAELALPE